MEEKDPNVDKLKPIAEDAKWGATEDNEGYLPWTFTVVGDTQKYTTEGGETTYSAMVIKSLAWPGSVTVVKGSKYTGIYMGYGIKHLDTCWNPISPADVMADPDAKIEKPEPTPLNAPPDKPEPLTEGVKNPDEEGEGNDE